MSRYTDAENEHLRSLYEAGRPPSEIAHVLQRPYGGIVQQIGKLIRCGYMPRRETDQARRDANALSLTAQFASTPDLVATMRSLYAAGESIANLARASGIGYPRAYYICTSEHEPPARTAKGSVTVSTWVGLNEELIAVAHRLGNGNVSAGVRRALELASSKRQD